MTMRVYGCIVLILMGTVLLSVTYFNIVVIRNLPSFVEKDRIVTPSASLHHHRTRSSSFSMTRSMSKKVEKKTTKENSWLSHPDKRCSDELGSGLMDGWVKDHQFTVFQAEGDVIEHGGDLTCFSTILPHNTPNSPPHSFCHGHLVIVDFSKMFLADAPHHRSGYFLGPPLHHYNYHPAAFSCYCTARSNAFELLSADHLRDIVQDGFRSRSEMERIPPDDLIHLDRTFLFVTREGGEVNNLFHTMTDFYNAFLMMKVFNLSREDVQVVILDNHDVAAFDSAWTKVFAPSFPLLRIRDVQSSDRRQLRALLGIDEGDGTGSRQVIMVRHAVFSPLRYSSIFYTDLPSESYCASRLISSLLSPGFSSLSIISFLLLSRSRSPPASSASH